MERKEIKYAQFDYVPTLLEKYPLPLWFVMLILGAVILKNLGLIGFVKDFWAGFKLILSNVFTNKNDIIQNLKEEIEDLKKRVLQIEKEKEIIHTAYEDMKSMFMKENLKYERVVASMGPVIRHLQNNSVDDLGLSEFLKQIESD